MFDRDGWVILENVGVYIFVNLVQVYVLISYCIKDLLGFFAMKGRLTSVNITLL